MKKSLILMSALAAPLLGMAQQAVVPEMVKNVYILKMSPNGKWLGNYAGDASLYDPATGEKVSYNECSLGIGNPVANNGLMVGSLNDAPAVMVNGEIIYPEALSDHYFCDLNGITPECTRVVANANNLNVRTDGVMQIPILAEINEAGVVSNVTYLPYPPKDLLGAAPQYVTACWISDDGKTVLGNVVDNIGWYVYPIVFTEGADGQWSYSLPSEPLFNPNKLEIPANPYADEPPYPEPENFMSGNGLVNYLKAYELYSTGAGPMPDPADYMEEYQYAEYLDAVNTYNEWYDQAAPKMTAFFRVYNQILATSPTFMMNDYALHPGGEFFMMRGGKVNDEGDVDALVFKFNLKDNTITEYNAPTTQYYPCQILPDGTTVVTKPIREVPSSMLLLPGATEFITMEEYFEKDYPQVSEWLKETVANGTGLVNINNDKTLYTGALLPDQLTSYDDDYADFYYSTYFIVTGEAGIESLVSDKEDGVYKVYDLNGVKLLETKDASEVISLGKGLYIINGKKVFI